MSSFHQATATWIRILLLAASTPAVVSLHLQNVCWSPTQGICGPSTCRVGNSYDCGETGECTCYNMNTGCGSNTSLPNAFDGKTYCAYRTDGNGQQCGWCAATSQCTTRSACPSSPPAPPPPPPAPPTPKRWRCSATRSCDTCQACCNSYLSNDTDCTRCVESNCHPEPPPVPCHLSPYNVTPAPAVLRGPCTCFVTKPAFPGGILVYTYSSLDYMDGASCDMRLPIGGKEYSQPAFSTEFQHDILQINGRNYSGISREVGDTPQLITITNNTDMYWWPDDKIVGTGWELDFEIPLPSQ